MKRILLLATVAFVVAAMMVATSMSAFAAPQFPAGTCGVGGPSGKGASGCAGNLGGFIVTQNQGCKEINRGPFFDPEEFSC
jgi:hypothetical protein